MNTRTLLARNLAHFWRTNLAVVAGVAAAVAVLAGALLVGDSVRASLRDLVLQRLGNVTHVITSENFFREQLAADIAGQPQFKEHFSAAAPLIVLEGLVTHEKSSRSASGVQIYAVDDRFFALQRRADGGSKPPQQREALLSPALAREFGAAPGDSIRVRVQNPSDVPVDTLSARKDQLARTLRFTVREVLGEQSLGEFSLRPSQGEVRALFVPLAAVQRELRREREANTILVAENAGTAMSEAKARQGSSAPDATAALKTALRATATLADFGLRVEPLIGKRAAQVESDQILLSDEVLNGANQAAAGLGLSAEPIFSYLATTIRIDGREIPYSLVTGMPERLIPRAKAGAAGSTPAGEPPIWLNDWAAADLKAVPGDRVTLAYLVWEEGGRLAARSSNFVYRGAVSTGALAADGALAPRFPGISESPNMSDWNPPFPVDLKRIRKQDEDYWHKYKTTPKAIIPVETAQQLWQSRYGRVTALRFVAAGGTFPSLEQAEAALRGALDPARAGITTVAVKAESTGASRGAINFGEYFVYFSFFIVVSALLLTGLFFKLGVEQRLGEIGLLQAIGFPAAQIQRLFLLEGALLAAMGCALGAGGAIGYGALMIHGLTTWWVGAVGTTALRLHVAPASLEAGVLGGFVTALASIQLTLRSLRKASPRGLLHGDAEAEDAGRSGQAGAQQLRNAGTAKARRGRIAGAAAALAALALVGAAAAHAIAQVGAFFGAGGLLLAAMICFAWAWLAGRGQAAGAEKEKHSLTWLGMKNAAWRPGRSLLCIALVASATFILVAVDAFRREGAAPLDPKSGTGGYPLIAESLVTIPYDPNTLEGKRNLNLGEEEIARLDAVKFINLRVRPGDDASCLNLYQPRNPKILGVPADFIAANRFRFSGEIAGNLAEKENPWLALEAEQADGTIPAIGDANSLAYVLMLKMGDALELPQAADPRTGKPIRLKIVGALADSMFQSELLISEKNFTRVFPYVPGFRAFLIDAPAARVASVTETLESGLRDYGFDVTSTGERLAAFHRVENTYLSTFQALGGLGLLLGTLGLAAVLLRNVLERRRELALLRAVGYRPADLGYLVVAENALLLAVGLFAGVLAAVVAIAPALLERDAGLPVVSIAVLLAGVLLSGLAASLLAVRAVVRAPLLAALRSE